MKLLTRFCVLALAAALLTASTCAEAEVAAGPESAAAPAGAALADGQCQVAPVGYEGPCPLGALPAFFDDFRYTSGHTTRSVADAPRGDIFGENAWMTAEGEEVTRAWYRYNRDDLPVPGGISFDDGVMRMLLPAGLSAEEVARSLIIHTGATFHSGTYHYRVRFAQLWPGQELRQTAWAISPESFFFETSRGGERHRYRYWSELDIEQQNHFQGSRETGEFVPDHIAQLTVANHYGWLFRHPGYPLALSTEGPVEMIEARGGLAREGFARQARIAEAPVVEGWWEQWIDLLIHVDPETRITTYQMQPVANDRRLQPVIGRTVEIDERFYPRRPMHFAFSVHWKFPTGHLRNDLWIDVDWIYHSPVSGLSVDQIEYQIEQIRGLGHARLNTTGRPSYHDHSVPLTATIQGPERVTCGDEASWQIAVNRAGVHQTEVRMRTVDTRDRPRPWQEVLDFEVSARPDRSTRGIEIEATLTDLWRRGGIVTDPVTGWEYPSPDNTTVTVSKHIDVTCPR